MPTKLKTTISKSVQTLYALDKALEAIRDHFDMEWGENGSTPLDIDLSAAIRHLGEARKELDGILTKSRGKALKPAYGRKPRTRKAVTVKELQAALVC